MDVYFLEDLFNGDLRQEILLHAKGTDIYLTPYSSDYTMFDVLELDEIFSLKNSDKYLLTKLGRL